MATDAAEIWRQCFARWPAEMERRGVLVTSFDEQISFDAFATSGDLLLIERRSPDTVGARTVLVAYQNIVALKIVDVVKMKTFQSMGFVAPAPRK
ncbi:MAG: hypothetical protein WD063_06245 [Pirellulales bacterium]